MIVTSEVAGNVWKIERMAGQRVAEGDVLMILESMKMEIPVESPKDGRITAVLVNEGQTIVDGQPLASIEEG
jgi:acetyl-CoA carboxylase biotin carboxyl carrier protein